MDSKTKWSDEPRVAEYGTALPALGAIETQALRGGTARDLMAADGYAPTWKERREPLPLETSVPGVFAADDLRAGAMNRVASAVGEDQWWYDSHTTTWR